MCAYIYMFVFSFLIINVMYLHLYIKIYNEFNTNKCIYMTSMIMLPRPIF